MLSLEDIRAIAYEAHAGQIDHDGQPHIDHVARVVDQLTTDDEKATGWLHDVIEDTGKSAEWLIERGVARPVVEAVQVLSRRELPDGRKESYFGSYIPRIRDSGNILALAVKPKDAQHNYERSKRDGHPLVRRYERVAQMLGFELS